MDAILLIVIGIVAAFILYFLIKTRDPEYSHLRYIVKQPEVSDQKVSEVVRQYLQNGQKASAIKYVADTKKIRLRAAKKWVDGIQKNFRIYPNVQQQTSKIDTLKYQQQAMREAMSLIKSGNISDAVNIVSKSSGIGIKEAQNIVEMLQKRL